MNKINRKLEYALMALKHMSGKAPGQLTSAKEIAESYGSPFDATARVLQIMGQHEILRVEHGPSGGYMIVKDLNKINFYHLTEMLLGPLGVAKCLQQPESCELASSCNIMTPVAVLNSKLIDFYKSLTIAELISSGSKSTVLAPTPLGNV